MAELVQLDVAANQVGKSEVTRRRLIKAGKIAFQKEKTLTGFIYLVDPAVVRAYYGGQGSGMTEAAADSDQEVIEKEERSSRGSSTVRVAVASESGSFSEYWQKKAEIYEDRYHHEMVKHSQTREELGLWRGRAEQAQSMLSRLLPATAATASPGTPEEKPAVVPVLKSKEELANWGAVVIISIMILIVASGAAYVYFRSLI